jgi:hypothetical protein
MSNPELQLGFIRQPKLLLIANYSRLLQPSPALALAILLLSAALLSVRSNTV